MIIAIDGYEANTAHRVGIGEYAYQLLVGIHDILKKRDGHTTHIRIYLPNTPHHDFPEERTFWKYHIRHPKKMWTFLALPASLNLDHPHPDVVFSPTHYIPRFINFPRAMSIMDLSYIHYPSLFRKKDYYQLLNWTKYSVSHARVIFTISEFTKAAIIESYNIPKERVIVTYPGLRAQKVTSESMEEAVIKKYRLEHPFILSVGTLQPRKNFKKLIEAFSYLLQKKEYKDLDLVIVGKKGWLYEEILKAPHKYHVEDSVTFLDFVPDEDLLQLYRKAECFVLPSLYEGFGLPVLEAMANGCIVVVSKVSSLPEIAGDAGIYIDPQLVESIEAGMIEALKEKGNVKGKKRIEKGKERIQLFRWDKAAEKTLGILEKVGRGEL